MSEAGDNRTPNASSTPGAGGAARRGSSSSRAGARSVNPVRRLEAATIDKGVDKAGAKLKGAQQYDEHGQPITTTRDKVVDTATDAVKDTTKVAAAAATGRTVTAVVTAARSNTGKKVLAGVLALALLAAAIPVFLIAAIVGSMSTNPDHSTYNRTVAVQTAARDLPEAGEAEMSWERFGVIGDLSSANAFVLAAIFVQGQESGQGAGPMTLDEDHDLVKTALEDETSPLTQDTLEDAEVSARWLADHLRDSMQEHLERDQFNLGYGYRDTNDGSVRVPLPGQVNEQRRQDVLDAWKSVVEDLPIVDASSRAGSIAKIARDWAVGTQYTSPFSGGAACTITGDGNGVTIPPEYRSALDQSAADSGLPAEILAAQIQAESNWDPNARSGAGAMGIAQFMPATWTEWGRGDPFDPHASIDAQGRYMGYLRKYVEGLDLHDGDDTELTRLALAAYNAGPGNVSKHGGVPPFLETQNYVNKIMGASVVECAALGPISVDGVGSDDYPYRDPVGAAGWSFPRSVFGHTQRQCTDFVMWRINQAMGWTPDSGQAPPFTFKALGVGYGAGQIGAGSWKDILSKVPGSSFHTSDPKPGDIAWWGYGQIGGGYGHVGFVAAVLDDEVIVEHYNFARPNTYSVSSETISSVPGFIRVAGTES